MNRKQLINILKIFISLVLLAFIFYTIDTRMLLEVLRNANPGWLALAVVVMFITVIVRAWRWQILLTSIGVPVSLAELTAIYLIGFLFNNLLPSGLGGDAIRGVEINRYSERVSDTITSLVVERFLGLFALQTIALIALVTNWGTVPPAVGYFTIAIFFGGLVGGALLINRPLYLKLRRQAAFVRWLTNKKAIGNLFESFQRYPLPALGGAYLVSILFNLIHIAMYMFIGFAVRAPVSPVQYAILVPITSLVLLVPISFAGLGLRENAFQQLYGQIGVLPEIAVAMSLLVYIIGNVCTGIVGGVIYLMRGARNVVSENR